MPRPGPDDYVLERFHGDADCWEWRLIEFGPQREIMAAFRALTQQIELMDVRFRIVRPDGSVETSTA